MTGRNEHLSRWRRFLLFLRSVSEHRWYPVGLALFAIILMLPSLGRGLFQDDLIWQAKLLQKRCLPDKYYGTPLLPADSGSRASALRDMFAATRTREDVRRLVELGQFPWWTFEALRHSNWRPLAALTHWVDYRLWPNRPWLMHAHNLLWFGAMIFVLGILYRRLMGVVPVAGLAAFLYVIDESNWFPAVWVANRNLLIALFFSVLAMSCHDRWRSGGEKRCGVVAPVLFLHALLSAEAAIAAFAYIFAYALVIDRGKKADRVLSLIPSLVVIVAWRLVYTALGNGAYGGGLVVDPGREPVRYALAVLEKAPLLLVSQWTWMAADFLSVFSEYAQRRYLLWAYPFIVLVFVVIIPLLRKDRISLFWFIGMLLCILPICATAPMNRNLLFVAIGGFGLMARYVGGVVAGGDWAPKSRMYRVPTWIMCVALLFMHVPIALAGRITSPMTLSFADKFFRASVDIGAEPDLPDKSVIVVNAPHPFLLLELPYMRCYEGKPLPKVVRVLAPGFRELEVARIGERTLRVRSKGGSLLSVDQSRKDVRPSFVYWYHILNALFRSNREVFEIGQRVELAEFSAEVLSVAEDGFPNEVRFDFEVALDDPSLRWLWWKHRGERAGFLPFEVPQLGESVILEGPFPPAGE